MKIRYLKSAEIELEDGHKVMTTYLGQGRFSTSWRNGERVYLINKAEELDYAKEIARDAFAGDANPHLPECHREGWLEDKQVFSMPFYSKLTGKDSKAWSQYKDLKSCWEKVFRGQPYGSSARGVDLMDQFIEQVDDDGLKEALQFLRDACCNYGDDYLFEFSPRNLGVSSKGELILRDVVFNREALPKR